MHRYLLFLLLTGIAQQFSAQQKNAFSLFEAKTFALENALTIQNSTHNQRKAELIKSETFAQGLPQVNINANYTNFINVPVQVVGASFINPNAGPDETIAFKAGTDFNSGANLQVNQLLFNGSYIVALQVSKFYIDFQASVTMQTKETVVFNVVQAYEMCAVAKDNLQFVDSMVNITKGLVTKQQNYVELGLMPQEELDQLEYTYLTSKYAKTSAELQYKNALSLLKLAMNYPMGNELELTEGTEVLMLMTATIQDKQDIYSNSTYTLLQKQKVLSEYNLKNFRYANLPTLNAVFQQAYNAYRNNFNVFANNVPWYPQTYWGIQLSIPIYSGGARSSRIKQAEITVMQDENKLKVLEQSLKSQELISQNKLIVSRDKLALQESNVVLAKKIYDNALIKEQIGNGNSLIVSQKYNQLMMAQSQYIAATMEVFEAKLSLDKLYNNLLNQTK
jgi:outer membrane protein